LASTSVEAMFHPDVGATASSAAKSPYRRAASQENTATLRASSAMGTPDLAPLASVKSRSVSSIQRWSTVMHSRFPQQAIAFVLASTGHGSFIVNRHDYVEFGHVRGGVGHQLLSTSYFDVSEVDLACALLSYRRRTFGDGVVGIDCGANIGVHTVEWARQMRAWGRVVGIEAQERLFYALAGNIAINNCDNARAIWAAAGATNGHLEIPTPDYQTAGSFGSLELRQSARSESIGQRLDPARTTTVSMLRLDDLELDRCDLVKIDVEGMELEVLAGAERTVRSHRPILLIEAIKCDWKALRNWLTEHRYAWSVAGINVVAAADTDSAEFIRTALRGFHEHQKTTREAEVARQRAAASDVPFDFVDAAGTRRPLLFGEGEAGVACLERGWTPPAPIYGPWSLEVGASVVLRPGALASNVETLNVSALVFAPQAPPFAGRRRVVIRIGGEVACDEVVFNASTDTVTPHTFSCKLPMNRVPAEPLGIEFHCENHVSPAEIGLAFDPRPIGLALMRIELA
jgi:FkbM family methyltransferase